MRKIRRALPIVILTTVLVAPVAYAAAGFSDVPDDSPHVAGIQYVHDRGITSGCTASSYCPDAPVTRAQMATFLYRESGNGTVAPSVNAATLDGHTADELMDGGGPTGPQVQAYGKVALNVLQPDSYHVTGVRTLGGGTVCVAFATGVQLHSVVISDASGASSSAPAVFMWDGVGCSAGEIRVQSRNLDSMPVDTTFTFVVY